MRYEEKTDLSQKTGQPLWDALQLPESLQLFFLKEGSLIEQDRNELLKMHENYVESCPLDADGETKKTQSPKEEEQCHHRVHRV